MGIHLTCLYKEAIAGEELKGAQVLNISRGTKNSTRLTSKYILQGKDEKGENNYKAVEVITFFGDLSLRQ